MDTSELIYSWKTTEMIKSMVTTVTASLYMTITVHAHDLIQWSNSLKKLRPTHGIQTHTAQEAHWGRQVITPVDSPPRLGHRPSSVILSWGAANVPEQLPSAHPPDQLTKILCPIISFPKPAFRSGVACVVSATLGVLRKTASRTGSGATLDLITHGDTLLYAVTNFILNYPLSTQRSKFKTKNETERVNSHSHAHPGHSSGWRSPPSANRTALG